MDFLNLPPAQKVRTFSHRPNTTSMSKDLLKTPICSDQQNESSPTKEQTDQTSLGF